MRACAGLAAAASFLAAAFAPPGLPLATLLQRTGAYVVRFEAAFSAVVGEERYTQLQTLPLGPGLERDLVSDFLLVRTRDTAAWTPFRDVFEVDGKQVRDRQERLTQLILQPGGSASDQVAAILAESARFNLGIERTINVPVLVLSFLDPALQPRFVFKDGGMSRVGKADTVVVDYEERVRPSIIRGPSNSDVPAAGRVWIDPASGRVLRTELRMRTLAFAATITTDFETEPTFGVDVPAAMHEEYRLSTGSRITGRASYAHFRRFGVQVTETAPHPAAASIVEPRTGMTFVEITAGRFTMGSPAAEAGRNADEAPHEVAFASSFLLGQHEVTQQEWQAIMHTRPSEFGACGPRCPVERVTYADVEGFLRALNAAGADLRFRLPTEAEWEYACRAGTTTPFSTGANLTTDQANYNGSFPYAGFPRGRYRAMPTPAGTFPSNPWGLADMHGNVWEWTSDWYAPYPPGPLVDPHGPPDGEKKVIRGGSWYFDANSARCALRYTHAPADRGFSLGFRVAADRVRLQQ